MENVDRANLAALMAASQVHDAILGAMFMQMNSPELRQRIASNLKSTTNDLIEQADELLLQSFLVLKKALLEEWEMY